jgi:membrane-bound lytic murein transglycosylase MltF
MVRPGPAFYFTGPDGALAGFDVELAQRFAAEKKLSLRFMLADSAAQVLTAVANEEAHIGAGGLYRPLSLPPTPTPIPPAAAATATTEASVPEVAWTTNVVPPNPC